jgi:hypothetical protein
MVFNSLLAFIEHSKSVVVRKLLAILEVETSFANHEKTRNDPLSTVNDQAEKAPMNDYALKKAMMKNKTLPAIYYGLLVHTLVCVV